MKLTAGGAVMRRFEAFLLLSLTICMSTASAQNNDNITATENTRDGKGMIGRP